MTKISPYFKRILINKIIGSEVYSKCHPETRPLLLLDAIKQFKQEIEQEYGTFYNYEKDRCKRNGFKDIKEYHEYLAQKNGFNSHNEYLNHLAKKRKKTYIKNMGWYKLTIKKGEKIDIKKVIMALKKDILKMLKSLGDIEVKESKKVFFDKNANQFSIKIPKSLAVKSKLDGESIFDLVLKTKNKETLKEIKDSGLTIFLKKS